MSTRTIHLPPRLVAAVSATPSFHPVTGWMPTAGFDKARVEFELISKTGNFAVGPAFQVADAEASPPGATTLTAIGSSATADGVTIQTSYTSISTDAASKRLIRFGWAGELTSGSSLATGCVAGKIDLVLA